MKYGFDNKFIDTRLKDIISNQQNESNYFLSRLNITNFVPMKSSRKEPKADCTSSLTSKWYQNPIEKNVALIYLNY